MVTGQDSGARTDAVRRRCGFLGVDETAALADVGVTVLDPCSTLVSPRAQLGQGVVLWPGTSILAGPDAEVLIGSGVVLYPGTRIAAASGRIGVGDEAELGEEGGFTLRVDTAGMTITVGAGARLLGGGSLSRSNEIGTGAQILGPIRAQDCRLGGGGTHAEPDPDLRGGVLKGCGVARGLVVPRGHVIQAFGVFADAPLRRQTHFHPKENPPADARPDQG